MCIIIIIYYYYSYRIIIIIIMACDSIALSVANIATENENKLRLIIPILFLLLPILFLSSMSVIMPMLLTPSKLMYTPRHCTKGAFH